MNLKFALIITLLIFIFIGCNNNSEKLRIIYTAGFNKVTCDIENISNKIEGLKKNINNTKSIVIDAGGISGGLINEDDLLEYYNRIKYDFILPAFEDLSTETQIILLNKINAPKLLTNAELADTLDSKQFYKSLVIEIKGVRFLTLGLIEIHNDSGVNTIKKKIQYEEALKTEFEINKDKFDFVILAANMSFAELPKICMNFSEIDIVIWSDGFNELRREKKLWNDIIVVNSGNMNEYVGALDILFSNFTGDYKFNTDNYSFKNKLYSLKK